MCIPFLLSPCSPAHPSVALALKGLNGDLPEMKKASVSRFVWGTTYIRAWHVLLEMHLFNEVQHNKFKCIDTADEKVRSLIKD